MRAFAPYTRKQLSMPKKSTTQLVSVERTKLGNGKKRNLQVNTTLNGDSATRACVLGINGCPKGRSDESLRPVSRSSQLMTIFPDHRSPLLGADSTSSLGSGLIAGFGDGAVLSGAPFSPSGGATG